MNGDNSMLLEFSCSNFRSFKDVIVFSTLASKDTSKPNNFGTFNDFRVLKTSVIYGANGSGKSNLIRAIAFMRNMVVNSINHQPGIGVNQQPHKTLSVNDPSTFAMQFTISGTRYHYGFTLEQSLVKEEFLYYFPNGRQSKIFDRSGGEFSTARRFQGKFGASKEVLKPNRLLLSCAANFSQITEIENVFKFFRDDLVICDESSRDVWLDYSINELSNNEKLLKTVINLFNSLGVPIKDISIKTEDVNIDITQLPPFLSNDFKAQIIKETQNNPAKSVSLVYDSFSTDLIGEESAGIRKLFGFLCPFLDIISKNRILIFDELESGLHESIVYQILNAFITVNNDLFPQLFFTTHDTNLLNLDLFRRDQIWFTEMRNDNRSTDLYSLSEFKNVRKDENFEKGYINGKYGAIPMLNGQFAISLKEDLPRIDSNE